ncbi:MAG: CDP-glycerol glycerophosphotransferase family protein [Planctomycetota bacterium]
MANLGHLLARLVLLPLYLASGFVKRRKDLWVFGSWGGYRFADNSAAFFMHCKMAMADRVRLVWITRDRGIVRDLRDKGYEAHYVWSLRGVLAGLRAGVYLFDSFAKDINFWTSRGALHVNLWSGVPLKTFERDIDNPRNRYYRLFHGSLPERIALSIMMPWHVVRPDLIIATSPETAEITRRAFDVPEEAVVVTGFPRNDVFFAPRDESVLPERFAAAVRASGSVFLYLPTYRDSGKSFLNLDWAQLGALMERLDATFFFKFHPDDKTQVTQGNERIVELPTEIDIYDLLPRVDALISDYSSILFDYMLLDRPTIHYLPDLEEFVASSRALNFDPVEIAMGPVCRTQPELMEALTSAAQGDFAPFDRRPEVRNRINSHHDGDSCRRVLASIEARLGAAQNRDVPAVVARP